jgi:RNase_H superfamily
VTIALERIRTLRQQSGQSTPTRAPPAPASPPAAPRPASQTVEDLRRLLRVRAPTRVAHAIDTDRTLPGDEIAPGLRLIETTLRCDPLPQQLCGAFDRRVAMIPTDNVMFFDTETTGLAGGTGTRAFMIGIAQWREGALHLRQWLMTTLGAERDLLTAFADTLRADTVLASYNGKSYDAPLLATRFRLARLPNPLAGLTKAAGKTAASPPSNVRYWASSAKTTSPAAKPPPHGSAICAVAQRATCAEWPITTGRIWRRWVGCWCITRASMRFNRDIDPTQMFRRAHQPKASCAVLSDRNQIP